MNLCEPQTSLVTVMGSKPLAYLLLVWRKELVGLRDDLLGPGPEPGQHLGSKLFVGLVDPSNPA